MIDLYSESETDIDDISYYWNGYKITEDNVIQ